MNEREITDADLVRGVECITELHRLRTIFVTEMLRMFCNADAPTREALKLRMALVLHDSCTPEVRSTLVEDVARLLLAGPEKDADDGRND